MTEAYDIMFVNAEHNQNCETACLDCLLTFGAQESMSKGLLQHCLTLQILDALLKGESLPIADMNVSQYTRFGTQQAQSQETIVPAAMRSTEKRQQRAEQKKRKKR